MVPAFSVPVPSAIRGSGRLYTPPGRGMSGTGCVRRIAVRAMGVVLREESGLNPGRFRVSTQENLQIK